MCERALGVRVVLTKKIKMVRLQNGLEISVGCDLDRPIDCVRAHTHTHPFAYLWAADIAKSECTMYIVLMCLSEYSLSETMWLSKCSQFHYTLCKFCCHFFFKMSFSLFNKLIKRFAHLFLECTYQSHTMALYAPHQTRPDPARPHCNCPSILMINIHHLSATHSSHRCWSEWLEDALFFQLSLVVVVFSFSLYWFQ